MCPSLIQIGSKTAEKKLCTNKQTDKQTNRHYENNGHLAVNQYCKENVCCVCFSGSVCRLVYLKNPVSELHKVFYTCYLCPWLGPLLTTMQYVMYFRFCG